MGFERALYAFVVGRVLISYRATHKLTQKQLAQKAELSQSSLSRFECGQSLPDIWEISAIAPAFMLTGHELLSAIDSFYRRALEVAHKARTKTTRVGLCAVATLAVEGCAL